MTEAARSGGWQLCHLLCATFAWLTSTSALGGTAAERPRHELEVAAGLLSIEVPGVATAGVSLPAGPGSGLAGLFTPDSADLAGGAFNYGFNTRRGLWNWLDHDGRSSDLTLYGGYANFHGDATAYASLPSGGIDTALLLTRLQPPPKPQPVFGGPAGLRSSVENKVDYGRIALGVRWLESARWAGPNTQLMPRVQLAWTQYNYNILSRDSFDPLIIPPVNTRNSRDQYMQQDLFELLFGGRLQRDFGRRAQFSVFGDLAFTVTFLKAKFTSLETVITNTKKGRRFKDGSVRETHAGAVVGLGLAWQFAARWKASLTAQYEPWVPTATIINPTTAMPGERDSYPDSERVAHTSVLLGVGYSF